MDTAPFVDVRVTQRFGAPADRLFSAWIDPSIAGQWLFATASRRMARVSIDARAGGSFRFEDARGGEEIVQFGQYVEIARPRRLVFTLAMAEHSHQPTRVTVEIAPVKSGCELTLVHENVLPDRANRTEARWTGMLYGLATLLGRGAGREPHA